MKITLEATENIIQQLKTFIENTLSDYYYHILFTDINELSIEERLLLIKTIKELKESIFVETLDIYNGFLKNKVEKEALIKRDNQERKIKIEQVKRDMKSTGFITVSISILAPAVAPFLVIANVPRIGLDYLLKNLNTQLIELHEEMMKEYDKLHQEFFQLTDTLRTDYHRSKKEIEKLKRRTQEGEDITEELLKLVNPETIGLKKTQLLIPANLVEKEEAIQYTKK